MIISILKVEGVVVVVVIVLDGWFFLIKKKNIMHFKIHYALI